MILAGISLCQLAYKSGHLSARRLGGIGFGQGHWHTVRIMRHGEDGLSDDIMRNRSALDFRTRLVRSWRRQVTDAGSVVDLFKRLYHCGTTIVVRFPSALIGTEMIDSS